MRRTIKCVQQKRHCEYPFVRRYTALLQASEMKEKRLSKQRETSFFIETRRSARNTVSKYNLECLLSDLLWFKWELFCVQQFLIALFSQNSKDRHLDGLVFVFASLLLYSISCKHQQLNRSGHCFGTSASSRHQLDAKHRLQRNNAFQRFII